MEKEEYQAKIDYINDMADQVGVINLIEVLDVASRKLWSVEIRKLRKPYDPLAPSWDAYNKALDDVVELFGLEK